MLINVEMNRVATNTDEAEGKITVNFSVKKVSKSVFRYIISNEFQCFVHFQLMHKQSPGSVLQMKIDLKNFAKFTGKHLYKSVFLIKLQA